jgi:hypothetical protein
MLNRIVLFGIIEILVLACLGFMIYFGFEKQEKVDCLEWQRQAATYPDFFLTKWQKDQCDAHKIPIEFVRVING